MRTVLHNAQIPCPACQRKDKPDTDTAGSSTTKRGGPKESSQSWHIRIRRGLTAAGNSVLEAVFTTGSYRIR